MPARAWSVWRQTSERAERKPLSPPSVKGELAKSAVATGCKASETRSFLTISPSLEKSRLVCTVAVRNIISSPRDADLRHIFHHDRVALLGHQRNFAEPPFGAHAERQKAYP